MLFAMERPLYVISYNVICPALHILNLNYSVVGRDKKVWVFKIRARANGEGRK
jgi:hypothetical protein